MDTQACWTGADALLGAAAAGEVELCFANPGTTEMSLVAALARQKAVRPVLCLFEGVCSAAADGYGRVAGKPALTVTHLGPGFANALANLHNARRGRSPVVNVIGEHRTSHLSFDAPLTSDIGALARTVSARVDTIESAGEAAAKMLAAIAVARVPPGQVATLIFPADYQQAAAAQAPSPPIPSPSLPVPEPSRIADAVARLHSSAKPLILLGGNGLTARGQHAAHRVAAHTGARLISETFPSVSDRGHGLPSIPRLPYFPEPAIAVLAEHEPVVLAGADAPVSFFGYAGLPSALAVPGSTVGLAGPREDAAEALEQLAERLEAPPVADASVDPPSLPASGAALTPDAVAAALVPRIPEGAVVAVEGGTLGYPYFAAAAAARPHRAICLSGGAIGFALPAALGAALANGGRPVVALTGDGAALYTSQALWSIAREGLPVIVCVAANRSYGIVRTELQRAGLASDGPAAALTGLTDPPIDWVSLARGYGVPGSRAETVGALSTALERTFAARAPAVVELAL